MPHRRASAPHNPSGHCEAAQRDVLLDPGAFGRFFAERGMIVHPGDD